MTVSNRLQFCKFRSFELEENDRLISSIFQTSTAAWGELYQKLDAEFEKDDWLAPRYLPRSSFQSEDSQFQSIYERSPSVGVDLPSLLELDNGNENKPTVVLLGQDPKRGYDSEKVSIGTPYGLHSKKCREELSGIRFYFDMIQVLTNMGYRVYLTDVFKIWICNPERRYKGIQLPKVDKQQHLKILESEILAMKPAATITWGSPANIVVEKMSVGSYLNFPHPSGAANGAWKKLIGKSPTRENKLAYWKLKLEQTLANHQQ